MALIKIPSAEVIRHVGTNGGFAVQEYVELPDGRTFPKTYTVWHRGEAPEHGAIVSVTGVLGVKIREYMTGTHIKHAADISVNEPTFEIIGQPKPATAEATAEAIQTIADDLGNNLAAPF